MKLNLSLIEKEPLLQTRLKQAAKESVSQFFVERDVPEEALEYVVMSFLLGEPKEKCNERLQALFERDCTAVVDSLIAFVENNPEFRVKEETKKEQPKGKVKRQKIVWDAALEKGEGREEDKKSGKGKSVEREKPTKTKDKERTVVLVDKDSSRRRSEVVKSNLSKHRNRENGSKARYESGEDGAPDRWQSQTDPDLEPGQIVTKDSSPDQKLHLKVPRIRLFENALGKLKKQVKSEGLLSSDELRKGGEVTRVARPREEETRPPNPRYRSHSPPKPVSILDRISFPDDTPVDRPFPLPVQQAESILTRIRKPDGSEFEEWELNQQIPQTRKRLAEPLRPEEADRPAGLSEVESLELKVAKLEREIQSFNQRPAQVQHYPTRDTDKLTICVTNVNYLVNEEIIAAHFHACGPIQNIVFPQGPYGYEGYCFVQFMYEDSVSKAMELDQSLLLDRHISIHKGSNVQPFAPYYQQSDWRQQRYLPPGEAATGSHWHQGNPDIKDFAIDTGSQDMP